MAKIETLKISGEEDKFSGLTENQMNDKQKILEGQRLEAEKKMNQINKDLERLSLARFENGKKK